MPSRRLTKSKAVKTKPTDKAPSLLTLDEWTAATLRNFLSMTAEHQRESATHSEKFDLVRLAIELARLRGLKEPELFLDEAARLLTEARAAVSRERKRPEREAKERSEQALKLLEQCWSPGVTWTFGPDKKREVPFDMLFKAGKSETDYAPSRSDEPLPVKFVMQNEANPPQIVEFTWKRFTSRRGFTELLESFVKRRDPTLACTQNEHLARMLKSEVEKCWQLLEAGKWPIEEVRSLHVFRTHKSSERNQKAMKTRLAKSKDSKQTKT
jgi:hypothetical protein